MSSYHERAEDERAEEKPAPLPKQLDEPVVWLSAAQASTVAAHPGLAALELALPCWAPQRLVGRALGHGPGGVGLDVGCGYGRFRLGYLELVLLTYMLSYA